jgi:hypothetical protein
MVSGNNRFRNHFGGNVRIFSDFPATTAKSTQAGRKALPEHRIPLPTAIWLRPLLGRPPGDREIPETS